MSGTRPEVLQQALDNIKNTYGQNGRMAEPMWKNVADALLFAGTIKSVPPVSEGTLWTNRYLVNIPPR